MIEVRALLLVTVTVLRLTHPGIGEVTRRNADQSSGSPSMSAKNNCERWEEQSATCRNARTSAEACSHRCTLHTREADFVNGSLLLEVKYVNLRSARMLYSWNYTEPPSDNTSILVQVTKNNERSCICLPASVKNVEIVISSPPNGNRCAFQLDKSMNVSFEVSSSITTHKTGNGQSLSKHYSLRDCWAETGRDQSYSICGVQVPTPPTNVTAIVSYHSNTTVTITWDTPLHYNTPLASFYLEYCMGQCVEEFLPVNSTMYTLNTSEPVTMEGNLYFYMRTGVSNTYLTQDLRECYIVYNEEWFGPERIAVLKWESPPPSPSPTPITTTTPNQTSPVPMVPHPPMTTLVAVISAVTTCVLSCLVFAIVFTVWLTLRRRGTDVRPLQQSISVFLVSSTAEGEDTNYKIRQLVYNLAKYGIRSVWYEYEKTRKDGPAAVGISQWVETQFKSSDYVLFICTEQFVREWNRDKKKGDMLVPVVWSSRHMLDGVVAYESVGHKFIVVFLEDNHEVPTNIKKFKSFKIFKGNEETVTSRKLLSFIVKNEQRN